MKERSKFLQGLKDAGLIVDYMLTDPGHAVVTVKYPISYLQIELVQKKCECGCCDVPDHGPCITYELGGNGRCAHCDHSKPCHKKE